MCLVLNCLYMRLSFFFMHLLAVDLIHSKELICGSKLTCVETWILGALVEDLDAARQRLIDELNKPPNGKQVC